MLIKKISLKLPLSSGQSLVELLLVIGLLALILPALIVGYTASREGRVQSDFRFQAALLLREGEEAVRSVREKGWSNLTNGTFHPQVDTDNSWTLVADSEVINSMTRSIVVSDVYRDASGNIVSSGGTLDPSTKKVATTVGWNVYYPAQVESTNYYHRIGNIASNQTSQAEFDPGVKTNTVVTNTTGGEVTLSPNIKGQWCSPNLAIAALDLPGLPNAVYATEGRVFAAMGQVEAPATESFAYVLVSNANPPVSTLHGKFRGYQANAVFGGANHGYIATTNNSKEVIIVDLNNFSDPVNKIYAEAGYFNTTTNTGSAATSDATSVFVFNSRGYVTAGEYLYVFDLASQSGSRPRIGNRIQFANAGDNAGEVYVRQVGGSTYAFVAIQGSTPDELKILNVTNHTISTQWRVVGGINIEPNNCSTLESGKAVYVKPDGTRAYISSVNDTTFKEFFAINTTNKASPSLVGGVATNPPCTNGGGYEAGGMNPEQSVVVQPTENRAILVGTDAAGGADSEEYQVLDLTNEANPTRCGGLQINQGVYGVAAVKEADGDAFAYIVTGDVANELKIIEGGPDGQYVSSGEFESSIIDAGSSAVFNSLDVNFTEPANTDIKFQVAVADAVAGSCMGASFNYVGPDGSATTYFENDGTIPNNDNGSGYENPGQCFKLKAFLSTTNQNTTPVLLDYYVNYSP